eukprot:5747383-Amphidinium_carterae.1
MHSANLHASENEFKLCRAAVGFCFACGREILSRKTPFLRRVFFMQFSASCCCLLVLADCASKCFWSRGGLELNSRTKKRHRHPDSDRGDMNLVRAIVARMVSRFFRCAAPFVCLVTKS